MKTNKKNLERRSFLKLGAAGLAGIGAMPSVLTGKSSIRPGTEKEAKMIYRTLGKTGIKLPIVSMGVMNAENPNLVQAALDSGIVHLDTAHGYQRGRNEEMIGKVVIERPRDSFVIATKVGYPKDRETGDYPADTTPQKFMDEFDISLKRLQMDYVDILYMHSFWTKATVYFEPMLKFLEAVKKAGKAKFVGFTTHRNEAETINAGVESKFYDVILTSYNFRHKEKEKVREAIVNASQAGVGIIAMKTLSGGYWDREKLEPINGKAALKWALQEEHVHTSIPGFNTFDQMELDLSVMEDLELTSEELKDLKLDNAKPAEGMYCQQCEGCLSQCPQNLPLPDIMRGYMYAYSYKNLDAAHDLITSLDLPENPCADCGSCTVSCFQGFNVREKTVDICRLKYLSADFFV